MKISHSYTVAISLPVAVPPLLPVTSTTWFPGDCIHNAVVAGAGFLVVWMPLVLHANAFLFFVSGCVECKHNSGENLHPAALFFLFSACYVPNILWWW